MSGRIRWIDSAKLLGIFLVILGHIPLQEKNIVTFIYAFHMPLFFFLSGITAKDENVVITVKKGIRQLIIPYVCFYCVTYAWWFIMTFWRHSELFNRSITEAVIKPLCGMLLGLGHNTTYSTMVNIPLWFLPCLFSCKVIHACLNTVVGRYARIMQSCFAVLFVGIAYLLFENGIFIPLSVGSAFLLYPFFYGGKLIGATCGYGSNRKALRPFCFIAVAIVFFLATYLIAMQNTKVNVERICFGKSLILFYIAGCFGIVACMFGCYGCRLKQVDGGG